MFICKNYKKELLLGLHNISDDYYMALFNGEVNKDITSYYKLDCELSEGLGYNVGGKLLINAHIIECEDTAILNFDNPLWENCSFEVKGALIYNNSLDNKNAIAVINFDKVYTTSYDDFLVQFPIPNKEEGFIKIRG